VAVAVLVDPEPHEDDAGDVPEPWALGERGEPGDTIVGGHEGDAADEGADTDHQRRDGAVEPPAAASEGVRRRDGPAVVGQEAVNEPDVTTPATRPPSMGGVPGGRAKSQVGQISGGETTLDVGRSWRSPVGSTIQYPPGTDKRE
jgi:hypothetical protein